MGGATTQNPPPSRRRERSYTSSTVSGLPKWFDTFATCSAEFAPPSAKRWPGNGARSRTDATGTSRPGSPDPANRSPRVCASSSPRLPDSIRCSNDMNIHWPCPADRRGPGACAFAARSRSRIVSPVSRPTRLSGPKTTNFICPILSLPASLVGHVVAPAAGDRQLGELVGRKSVGEAAPQRDERTLVARGRVQGDELHPGCRVGVSEAVCAVPRTVRHRAEADDLRRRAARDLGGPLGDEEELVLG